MDQGSGMSGGAGSYAPKGVGDIVKSAFEVYGKHWARLLVIAAVLIIPVTIIVDLIIYLVIVNATSIGAVAIGAGLASVLSYVLYAMVQAAIARGAASALVGDPGVDDSFSYGLKRLGSYIWIGILVGLIVAAPVLLAVLFLFISPGLGAFLLLVAFIAVIFISTMLAVAIPSLVIENRRGTDALARSWELVKGHFWHAFGAMFLAGLIYFVVAMVVGAIFGNSLNWLVRAIGDSVIAIIAMPFWALIGVVLYVDLRARVENVTPDQIREQLQANK